MEKRLSIILIGFLLASIITTVLIFQHYFFWTLMTWPSSFMGINIASQLMNLGGIIFAYVADTGMPLGLEAVATRIVFFVSFIAVWGSIPLVLRYTKGMKRSERILSVWIAMTQISYIANFIITVETVLEGSQEFAR